MPGGQGWASRAADLAARRTIAPNSVAALAFLLALCAAGWLSGGSVADNLRGLLALAGWALVRLAARTLDAAGARRGRERPGADRAVRRGDCLVLPGSHRSFGDQVPRPAAMTMPLAGERGFGWLLAVSTVAAEGAVYGGIAAGGLAAGWTGTWPLAIITVIFVSVADIARTCGQASSGWESTSQAAGGGRIRAAASACLPPPVSVKVLLAALAAVRYGPRLALVGVCAMEVLSLSRTVADMMTTSRAWPPETSARSPAAIPATACPGQDVLLACRDDGHFARFVGRHIKGNLAPLPPALAGFVAVISLAALGMKNLPGVIALTPAVVLLLAAPGSSHPHDGRSDWLVPVLMSLSQYSYLAALGLASPVPDPLVYATCAMTALWYAGLAASPPSRQPGPAKTLLSRQRRISDIVRRRADGPGWEARAGLVALTSMSGMATFGYLGLAAYLAALMCRKVLIGYLILREGQQL